MTSHMPPSTWPATRARSCTARCTTSTAAAGAPPSSSRPRATCSTVTGEGADLLTARADPSPSEDRAKQRVLWPDPSGNGRKMRRNQGPWARAGATGNPCKRPNSAPTAAWIAPRRSGVRVPLAPLGDPPAHVGVSSFGGLRAPGNRIAWAVGCRLSASSVRRVRPPRTVAVASHHSIRMTRRPIRRAAGRRCATGMSLQACLPRAGVRPPFRVTTDRGMRSAPITSSSVVGGRAAASGRQTK